MDAQQQLFGLMAIAEDQQKAVSEALAGLEREREALARERQALASERADLVPAVRKISRDAFAGAAGVIEKAARPSIDGLSDVVKAAGALEGRLSMRWLSWCPFPAYAGMNRAETRHGARWSSVPRVCGDEPTYLADVTEGVKRSPRMRG